MLEQVDLDSIAPARQVTRHDVKVRIEEFNALAGHEHVHKGHDEPRSDRERRTAADPLLELVHAHGVAVAARLAERAATYRDLVMAGRSHNVAAQATTLGKRFASAAQETLIALTRIRDLIDRYPLRGIKGPMGTAQDMLDLLDGDTGASPNSSSGSRSSRLHRGAHQRRSGLPALAGPRRGLGPGQLGAAPRPFAHGCG